MRISDWSSDVCSSDLGFHNVQAIAGARYTADAVPFNMYLNLDKPLVAFWVLLALAPPMADRKSGVLGKSVSVRVVLGGRCSMKKKIHKHKQYHDLPVVKKRVI